jgi:signal transduction histidine kinase
MRFWLLILFLCMAFISNVSGQIVHIEKNAAGGNIGSQVTYFEDKQATIGLDSIKAIDRKGGLVKGTSEILNFGNSKSAFWVKIIYTGSGSRQDYLVIDAPNIEQIDCYVPSDTGTVHLSSGSSRTAAPGVTIANNYVFALPGNPGSAVAQTLWLRVKTNNILLLPIKMAGSGGALPAGNAARNSFDSIYIGLLLALFIYNIFLYFSIKDRAYIYYCLYVLMLGIYVAGYLRGYGYLMGQDARIALNLYPHVFASLAIAASLLFCKSFLHLPGESPGGARACDIGIGSCLILLVISLAGYKSIAAIGTQVISFITPIVLLVLSVLAYRRGFKPAKYYILAWTFISLAVLAAVLTMQGMLAFHDYAFEFLPIGSSLELLLLAFALGDRYRSILQNERKTREENFQLIRTQNQLLENLVEERTLSLKETITELEKSNTIKNKLFSIIAHDLRSPFNSLMSIFAVKDMDLFSLDDLKMMLDANRQNIDSIYNTLNNLLYWAKSQMEGTKTRPSAFNPEVLLSDLVLVYTPLSRKKNIGIRFTSPGVPLVYADEDQIQLVFRNLLDNAIKFTDPFCEIDIGLYVHANTVQFCVSNPVSSGSGFDMEKITSQGPYVPAYGTGQEKGIGLGLHLCREYIGSNGGELKVSLTNNVLSFCFQLPNSPS